ncbi:hypothetical protein NGM36_25020 [Streptomyces mutabilis]|uniref:phage tail protein n=1 Tax=Streptomyces mutabilis TaxID=67332 RepID=UPI0022BA5653|nr:hypothetical protein [Streptomyces mutabilis]MCZ9352993.1 hypothetical protein [Streptomyces mutabilis]
MATLESMTVRLGIDTDQLREGAERAKGILTGVGKAVAGLGVGVPVAAAVAAGVGGMAAAFASAGVAAKAFQLAAGPQLDAVAESAEAAAAAEDAHDVATRKAAEAQKLAAKGGKEYEAALKEAKSAADAAKDADAAYEQQLAGMPKATREMAKELAGLKNDHEEWSDSLANTTMPIFTKGLQVARRLLPLLTPFVEEAAKAFGWLVDEVDRATQGNGPAKFAEQMAKAGGQNLKSFLGGLKNIAVGIGGIIRAFLPLSDEMSGGFEESTAAFARWGQSLEGSEGFAQFVSLAKQAVATIGPLASAVLKLAVALAPLIGLTAAVALQLAEIINSMPPGAVEALAYAVLGAVVAFKTFKAASSAVESVSDMMDSRLGRIARRWASTAAASIKSGARMAGAAVMHAARTAGAWAAAAARATATWLATMIRVAAVTVARFAMMAARAVIWAATMAAQWLIAMGPIGWIILAVAGLVALIIAYWDQIKAWTIAAWNAIWAWIKLAIDKVLQIFLNWTLLGLIIKHWDDIKNATVNAWNTLVGWVKGIPGKLRDAFLNWTLLGLIIKHWSRIKTATVSKATEMVSWVKRLPGMISRAIGSLGDLLYGKGRDVVLGLWRGIKSMGGWLRSTLIGWAKSIIPGPVAKALGISSPSKLFADQIGRWIPAGIIEGAEGETPALEKAMRGLVDVPGLTVTARQRRTAQAAPAPAVRIELAGPEDMKRLIRKIVQVNGRGGDPNNAFGTL